MLAFAILLALLALVRNASGAVCHDTADGSLSAPILLSDPSNFRMQWKTLGDELTIVLSIHTSANAKWLGFGFPEQTSGGMGGSDVVTISFGSDGSATAEDRYVEWRAFPFYTSSDDGNYTAGSEKIPVSPSFFPERDCRNAGKDDWDVLASSKTATCLSVKMKRKFITGDTNDRDVPIGLAKFIWAYGLDGAFGYHGGGNRGTDSATFIPSPSLSATIQPSPSISDTSLIFDNYHIPAADTSYSCKTFWLNESIVNLDSGQQYDIIGFEPIIHPATKKYVHHIVVFGCPGSAKVPDPKYKSQDLCSVVGTPHDCFNMMYTWGVGASSIYMPPDVGMRVSRRNGQPNSTFAVWMQMHYTNLEHKTDLYDFSGVRLILDTSLKKHQAGVLLLGINKLVWEPLPPRQPMIHRQVTCPSGCTKYFKEPIHVFGSLLHMHEFGRKIWTSQYDYDGNFKGTVNRIDFWSFGNQQITP